MAYASTPRKAREDRALTHGRLDAPWQRGAPSPGEGGLPPSTANDSENNDKNYFLGHPPQEGDALINENGQSVIAVLDPKGHLRWRDTKTQQWAKAPTVLVEEDPLPLVGYGPASHGSARRRRSGSATRRNGPVDGLSEVSSIMGWEEVRTENSFGTFAEEDKSHGAASEDSPPKQPESPPSPTGSDPKADGGEEISPPSFADPDVAAPTVVPKAVQSLLEKHALDAEIVGMIRTLLECEVEVSKILQSVAKKVATKSKSQTPLDGGGPAEQKDPMSKKSAKIRLRVHIQLEESYNESIAINPRVTNAR